MFNLKLEPSIDPKKIGHLFCHDCATELNVVFIGTDKLYQNPNWEPDWNLRWHEFHNVRLIFPDILRLVCEKGIMKQLICPYCSYIGAVKTMTNGLFDVKLIRSSLDTDNSGGYKCARCEGIFASQKCVSTVGKSGLYVCGDCAMLS